MGVWAMAAMELEDGTQALSYVVALLLQSPHFLYRIDLGTGEGETRRYTSTEMASRLSFFIWNGPPDAELLDVAVADGLLDDGPLNLQVQRMLADEKARRGLRNFFTEWLQLYKLEEMRKDPNVFRHYSADLGAMAREETLLLVDALYIDGDASLEELFTSRRAFVNRRLAAIYDIPHGHRRLWRSGSKTMTPARLPGQVSFLDCTPTRSRPRPHCAVFFFAKH